MEIKSISGERIFTFLTKWRGVIISIVFVIVSSLLISISYGKKGDCSTLIYDTGVSIFTGALFAVVTFFLEMQVGETKEKRQINSIISKYHNKIDEIIFELDSMHIRTDYLRELKNVRELIGDMNSEICDCDIIYYIKAHQLNTFLVKLLLMMDRYIEILEKFEEDKKEEKELFCRLMSKLIVEERASLNEAKEQYPFDKFCVEDLDEVDKVALNGMIDLKIDSRLKVSDDYDFSHGTSWSTSQGMKKRYNIVDYYIFHILPKEKYFRISKDE